MAMRGAEMLIYPTAIGWESSDTQEEKDRQLGAWVTIQRGHAVANGLPVISVNRTGHEPDLRGKRAVSGFGETVLRPVPKVSY